jgi:O-antigen/teichoic acid export membrane protein
MFGKVMLTGAALVAFGLTKFLFNTLVIRWFPATFLGEINQLLSLFLLIPLFYAPVLGTVISKFAPEFLGANEPNKSKQVFSLSFVIVMVTSVVCTIIVLIFLRPPGGSYKIQSATLVGLAPMLVLYSIYIFLRTSYYGFDRIPLYLRNEIVSSIVFFVVLAVGLATRSQQLVVWPFAAQGAVFAAMAIYDLRDQFRFHAMLSGIAEDLRRCAHFSFHTMINSLTGPGAFHLGIILTGRLTGSLEIAGYYSVLLYALQPFNLLPISLTSVMIPAISRLHGAGQIREGVAVAERAFPPLFLVMTLIWGGGVILGKEAVEAISGVAAGQLIVPFEIVLLSVYLYLISSPPSVLLNSTRHVAVIAWGGAVAVGLGLAVWWWTIPVYGLLGSAAGYALLQAAKGVWAFVAAHRIFQWRGQFGWVAILTIMTVLVLGAVSLASESRLLHIAMAFLFVGLFFGLQAQTIKGYAKRLVAEVRSYASGTVKLSDGTGC